MPAWKINENKSIIIETKAFPEKITKSLVEDIDFCFKRGKVKARWKASAFIKC